MHLKDGGKTIELRILEKNPMPDFGLKPGVFPDQIIVKQRNSYDEPRDEPYETVRYVKELTSAPQEVTVEDNADISKEVRDAMECIGGLKKYLLCIGYGDKVGAIDVLHLHACKAQYWKQKYEMALNSIVKNKE